MRISTLFMNGKTKKIWTKSFRSKEALLNAVRGITKKTNNQVKTRNGWSKNPTRLQIDYEMSRGFKFGREIRKHNSTKHRW